ncbi:helix-turn-helix domain-containing protein [Sandaracinomonas limnophila]|jgi:AraC-like DNA-binding protein|uniref:Helix-turn-helix domain-containing protein n=1 Tax=Sandaracinomonas limnophila TaxID=1862386 RepID=A0A437PUM1_9BACT|nr:helix-turn-helix domain-containing protein [Sandaracinomonas limnophila]RVU25953.1 helix-turn-helix domain-containing protein [Sandaracinomonas limnophila]
MHAFSISLIFPIVGIIWYLLEKKHKENNQFSDKYRSSKFTNPILSNNLTTFEALEISTEQISNEEIAAETIDQYFSENEVFLNSQLTAELLSSALHLHSRTIGNSIRRKYGISFRDYINLKRLAYIEKNFLINGDYKKYSLDYIGECAGFGTRQSFYLAVKKHYNCTPKEFFEK